MRSESWFLSGLWQSGRAVASSSNTSGMTGIAGLHRWRHLLGEEVVRPIWKRALMLITVFSCIALLKHVAPWKPSRHAVLYHCEQYMFIKYFIYVILGV